VNSERRRVLTKFWIGFEFENRASAISRANKFAFGGLNFRRITRYASS